MFDPPKNLLGDLEGCEFIFVSVPVPASGDGQDTTALESAAAHAKKFSDNVFIRSTVLPGTNDRLGTTAMPEFLTERRAYEDFDKLPILVGRHACELKKVFPDKTILTVSNVEAELAKFTHNCFGAMKVTYFNIINELCGKMNADYNRVVEASLITGFIEPTHTLVPGPDGRRGYGGKCFPENIDAMRRFLLNEDLKLYHGHIFFRTIDEVNERMRYGLKPEEEFSHEVIQRASAQQSAHA
jgi:UDPglucose 6-dehydrogenase